MFKITTDSLSPALRKLAASTEEKRRNTLEGMGLGLVNMARRAFTNPSLRPSPWAKRKDDKPHALLLKTGTLRNSLRIVALSASSVTIGSDRVYSLIHQTGGTIQPKKKKALVFSSGGKKVIVKKVVIPPRPYFPIQKNGQLTDAAEKTVREIISIKLGLPPGK